MSLSEMIDELRSRRNDPLAEGGSGLKDQLVRELLRQGLTTTWTWWTLMLVGYRACGMGEESPIVRDIFTKR